MPEQANSPASTNTTYDASLSFDVVSCGETMLRFSPPTGGRLEEANALDSYTAGTESNTLACLSRLGVKTAWISALPANPLGRRVAADLRGHGVTTNYVHWAGGNARLGVFYVEEAANPLGLTVHYDRSGSAFALLQAADVDFSVVSRARLLHLTGITPALSTSVREIFQRFLAEAQAQGVPLSFDVNYRAKLWTREEAAKGVEAACRQARLLFCTQADANELWNLDGSPEMILKGLAEKFGASGVEKTIILTCGSAGSIQWENGAIRQEPAFPAEGIYRIGSGDAFAAGYLYAWLRAPLVRDAENSSEPVTPLLVGNAVAALKRCIPGDIAVVTQEEVRAVLDSKEGKRFR